MRLFWILKALVFVGIIAAVDYAQSPGKVFELTPVLLPFLFVLVCPAKWEFACIGTLLASALTLTVPILFGIAFGFHTNPLQDLRLIRCLAILEATSLWAVVLWLAHGKGLKKGYVLAGLGTSLAYYGLVLAFLRARGNLNA
ncbi:MAG: hypothetical protein JWO20_765 [Candidatus Angelobacter sp.]|nr:hypothetical protein [Candidatus Angelobacter sp.]